MEQKMDGHQVFFSGLLGEGLESPFISLHFHSFVFNTLPYFGKMFEEGSFLNFFKQSKWVAETSWVSKFVCSKNIFSSTLVPPSDLLDVNLISMFTYLPMKVVHVNSNINLFGTNFSAMCALRYCDLRDWTIAIPFCI